MAMTVQEIRELAAKAQRQRKQIWKADSFLERGGGQLVFRFKPEAVFAYFRYANRSKQLNFPLGPYAESGREGLTLREIRDKSLEFSRLYRSGIVDIHSHVEGLRKADAERLEAKRRAAEKAALDRGAGSFRHLLDGYVAHLKQQGKQAYRDVDSIFRTHVKAKFPDYLDKKAADITRIDINQILSRVVSEGKGRTAAKLRSYLQAAFSASLASDTDPTVHPALRDLNLEMNPAALVPAKSFSRFNRRNERHLDRTELRYFLKRLSKFESLAADVIRLNLYLCGQRMAQLLRLRRKDVDLEAGTITLYDSKGARHSPRIQVLPLTNSAKKIVKKYFEQKSEFLFSQKGVRLHDDTAGKLAVEIAQAMTDVGEAKAPFQLKHLRATIETMLSADGFSREVRAHLLSHGLGGIQTAHYDKYDYFLEKKQALTHWENFINSL